MQCLIVHKSSDLYSSKLWFSEGVLHYCVPYNTERGILSIIQKKKQPTSARGWTGLTTRLLFNEKRVTGAHSAFNKRIDSNEILNVEPLKIRCLSFKDATSTIKFDTI